MKRNKKMVISYLYILVIAMLIVTGCKNKKTLEENDLQITFMIDETKYYAVNLNDGDVLNLPVPPKKDGYVFDYWEYNGNKYTGLEEIENGGILKAVFKKIEKKEILSVILNRNNGEESINVSVIRGDTLPFINNPKKEGYNFLGWYLNNEEFHLNTAIEKNLVLEAKWGKIEIVPENNDNTNVEIKYGDVTEDGIIDTKDFLRLNKYLEEMVSLSKQGIKNADINADGKVDNIDVNLLSRVLAKWQEYENILPNRPIEDYIMYGDVTEDGIIDTKDFLRLNKYLEEMVSLSKQGIKNADINADGKVDNTDVNLLSRVLAKWQEYENILPNRPIEDYIMYGDVTEDGIIDTKDFLRLNKYLEEMVSLSKQGIKNADINADGKVDNTDVNLLSRVLAKWQEYENILPNRPIED